MPDTTYETFYVARQPVLTSTKEIFGYELLFRQGLEERAAGAIDPQLATMSVASGGLLRSSEDLLVGQKLLINFPDSLILEGAPHALPKDSVVVEILETVDVTPALVDAVAELKEQGFSFAIDDYTGDPVFEPLLPLVSMIKVDLMAVDDDELPALVEQSRRPGVLLLAEKVEDAATFAKCQALGFDLYQGYFFARPENLEGRRPPSASAGKLRIFQRLSEDLDIDELAGLVTSDPSLAYRLLRFLNSSAFSLVQEITSIHHAVRLLGLSQVKQWLRLVVVAELKHKEASPELLMMSMTRAKYLELLADDENRESFFLLGLLSLMDVIMQLPMHEVLLQLPLEKRLADALNEQAGPLHDYLESARAFERADWPAIDRFVVQYGLDPDVVKFSATEALGWATTIFRGVV